MMQYDMVKSANLNRFVLIFLLYCHAVTMLNDIIAMLTENFSGVRFPFFNVSHYFDISARELFSVLHIFLSACLQLRSIFYITKMAYYLLS